MRIVFARREHGRIEFGMIYGGIALLLLFAARFLPVLVLAPDCTFKLLTGFPCPTCGSTRSLVHLAHGRLFSAITLNPLTSAVIAGAVLAFLYGSIAVLFDAPRPSFSFSDAEERKIRVLFFLVLFANWAYLIATL